MNLLDILHSAAGFSICAAATFAPVDFIRRRFWPMRRIESRRREPSCENNYISKDSAGRAVPNRKNEGERKRGTSMAMKERKRKKNGSQDSNSFVCLSYKRKRLFWRLGMRGNGWNDERYRGAKLETLSSLCWATAGCALVRARGIPRCICPSVVMISARARARAEKNLLKATLGHQFSS